MRKTRLAVLGSGPGALASVWEITQSPNWQERYEIDIYAMGWRLGGKTASGRDPANRHANYEHGLHVLGGFYHNVFQQMTDVYAAWQTLPAALPIPFDNAFFEHETFSVMDHYDGGWHPIRCRIKLNDKVPGVDPEQVSIRAVLHRILVWMKNTARASVHRHTHGSGGLSSILELGRDIAITAALSPLDALEPLLDELIDGDLDGISEALEDALIGVIRALQTVWHGIERLPIPRFDLPDVPVKGADLIGLVGLALAMARGMLTDRLPLRGYDAAQDMDGLAWLEKYGASDRARNNVLFKAIYSYAFGFQDGDVTRPDMAVGSMLRGIARILFSTHGSIFVHMNGGMGEIFVLPYYDVLKARGVRFHFFHRVHDLAPDDLGQLDEIRFTLEAEPLDPDAGYDPVITYTTQTGEQRRSWPAAPLLDQLVDGAALAGLDLESWHTPLPVPRPTKVLRRGAADGFDLCIVAIPPKMLAHISQGLADVSPRWKAMLDTAGSCPTIAAQLWSATPVAQFSTYAADGLITAYEEPLDTWGDFSFLLNQESVAGPASLSYFCGPVSAPAPGTPSTSLPTAEKARAVTRTNAWANAHLGTLFPGLGSVPIPADVHTPVINSDPAKLYINTPAGSVVHRLRADITGVPNLLVSGDWTRSNFDMGAMEGAVMSARLCARAVCGYPKQVYGESDVI